MAAPDVGDFSPAAYAWFEAAEMIKSRDLESFLNEVQVAVDRQRYFDAEDKAFDAIANEPDYRKHQYIKDATEHRVASRFRKCVENCPAGRPTDTPALGRCQ